MENNGIKIGISSCLIGNKVRYDGRGKPVPWLIESLADQFELIPVCPEIQAGMTVPREAVRLVWSPRRISVIGHDTGKDWTDAILDFCEGQVSGDRMGSLCGYILKSGSPSCGIKAVPVYSHVDGNEISKNGVGLFAEKILTNFPDLPVVDEMCLSEKDKRQKFIDDVKRYARLHH